MYSTFLLVLVTLASGGILEKSPCKYAKPVENFDLKSYGQGIWYQLARYENDMETVHKCLTYYYTYEDGTTSFRRKNNVENATEFIEAVGRFSPDAEGTGKIDFTVSFKYPRIHRFVPVTFVGMDYNNYGLVYHCRYDENTDTKYENAWLLSRTKKLTGKALAEVENLINTSDVFDASQFSWLDFSDEACKE